eukprot:Skav205783  [mRNA]  locus=scaffold340:61612:61990:+ [translate_table: standard]
MYLADDPRNRGDNLAQPARRSPTKWSWWTRRVLSLLPFALYVLIFNLRPGTSRATSPASACRRAPGACKQDFTPTVRNAFIEVATDPSLDGTVSNVSSAQSLQ